MSTEKFDNFILGNGVLHEQFRITTEILGALVSSAPRPVSVKHLENYTGRSAKEVAKLCNTLCRAKLVKQDAAERESWTLACIPNAVTLEDVFLCVIANQRRSVVPAHAKSDDTDPRRHDIDLLVTQAIMAINQSVFRNLRAFSLDRLKHSAAAKPAPSRRYQSGGRHADVHDFEVNPWFI